MTEEIKFSWENPWGQLEIVIEEAQPQLYITAPDALAVLDLFYRTEDAKDIHTEVHTMLAIHHPAQEDPVAFVRWYPDKVVIDTEILTGVRHQRKQLEEHILTFPIEVDHEDEMAE